MSKRELTMGPALLTQSLIYAPDKTALNGRFPEIRFGVEQQTFALVIGREADDYARLIAAAPEMCEALKLLDADWTKEFPAGPETEFREGCRFAPSTFAIWQATRAALAKAEGREP